MNILAPAKTAADPERMLQIWQQHTYAEFALRDADAAVAVMTEGAYVLLVSNGAGACGREAVRNYYAREFLPFIPDDFALVPISQMFARDRIIEESVVRFTHSIAMDWLLPGVPPTGRRAEFAMIAVLGFEDGLLASERLYWDQAILLSQTGLIDLPMAARGAASTAFLLELAASGAA